MTYTNKHTEDDCDKCLRRVGKENLQEVPFLYLDRNDKIHEDAFMYEKDYKQYYLCKECAKKNV